MNNSMIANILKVLQFIRCRPVPAIWFIYIQKKCHLKRAEDIYWSNIQIQEE